MSMLKKVAAKAHNAIVVTDQTGTIKTLKLLNHLSTMVSNKNARLDGTAVADPEAAYLDGHTLLFPDNSYYIISRVISDWYRGIIIRDSLDLVLCNNLVTISRQAPQSNNQGGVKGHIDTIVYASLPCKIVPKSDEKDKVDDVLLNNYTIFIPSLNPVEVNDKLQFAHTFNPAKINGCKPVSEGLIAIEFNRDFRW